MSIDQRQGWGSKRVLLGSLAGLALLMGNHRCIAQVPKTNAPPDRAALAEYALQHEGDPNHGKLLFNGEKAMICANCHAMDEKTVKAGPDLSAVGDKYPRRDLISSILEPSSSIAVGYETTVITTKNGEDVQGVIKQATADWIEIVGGDGKPVRINTADIKTEHTGNLSLMPEGLVDSLPPQDFADLISYLETLHQTVAAGVQSIAMPRKIAVAAHPAEVTPFFRSNIKFNRPVWFGQVPGFSNRFVVLEHEGKGWMIERTANGDEKKEFVDLTGTVRVGGATGLLGLAFHPHFAENHKYYLQYQVLKENTIVTKLVERTFADDFRQDAGLPGRDLLEIEGATQDHHGGSVEFGPDGYVYFGMGDSGPQRDPQGHAQNLNLLLGKMLRIDIDHAEHGKNYAIPKDNPFIGRTNVRPEIWAYGFREPWRYSFDFATGDLWYGDVGQDSYEKFAIVRKGENMGWNVFEGVVPFSDQYRRAGETYTPPIFSYSHRVGDSATGGFVYHGQKAPAMQGYYICGDFQIPHLWALTQTNRVLDKLVEIGKVPSRLVAFGHDSTGELYCVGYDSGLVYQIDLSKVDPSPRHTEVIAATSEEKPVLWHYTLQNPPAGWETNGFDDAAWKIAPGGFGTKGTPGAIVRTDWHSDDIWLRREFTVSDSPRQKPVGPLALRLHHDEDTEVFLNGIEIAHEPRWTSDYIELPLNAASAMALQKGKNILAIHCHQRSGGQYIDAGLVKYVDARKE